MRTGAAAGRRGYLHEVVYYGSDDELLRCVIPFLRDGIAAAEPTVLVLGAHNAALVRQAMPGIPGLRFIDGEAMYTRPASAIKAYREMFSGYVADGARHIRLAGELPPCAFGSTWDWWARYESAANHAFDEYPVWSMCLYDTRSTPARVLDDVRLTHHSVAMPDGRHIQNDHYIDPVEFLSRPRPVIPDPLEMSPPLIELVDPTPAVARKAALDAHAAMRTAAGDADALVLAVSETVANALRYGLPPARLRLWAAPDRVVAAISDRGPGPTDPFVGLLPGVGAPMGGLGLWLTHELCDHVTMERSRDGFTLRLTVGTPPPTA